MVSKKGLAKLEGGPKILQWKKGTGNSQTKTKIEMYKLMIGFSTFSRSHYVWYQVPAVRHLLPGIWCQVPGA